MKEHLFTFLGERAACAIHEHCRETINLDRYGEPETLRREDLRPELIDWGDARLVAATLRAHGTTFRAG